MQKAFGYTYESLREAILPMAKNGGEGTSAMGIDTPLAALASDHQPLFNYFKQLFAQVPNPPIDSIREKVVTSTTVYIGEDRPDEDQGDEGRRIQGRSTADYLL